MASLSCIQQNDSTEANIDNKVATTDLKMIFIFESVFSFVRARKLSGWEKVEAVRQIHLFPIQVWRQVHINDSREETSAVAKLFDLRRRWQNVKSNQLWSPTSYDMSQLRRERRAHIQMLLLHNAMYILAHSYSSYTYSPAFIFIHTHSHTVYFDLQRVKLSFGSTSLLQPTKF